jgi:hypothetical protein
VNDNENRKRQSYLRARDFGAAHANDFAPNSVGKQQLTTLATIITEIDGHAASEVTGVGQEREGTTTRREAREALREALEAIRRTARVMAADIPGLDDKFRIPRNNNDQQLLSAARAFAADAEPLAAQFIAHEMPADFLANLNADIAALETAISNQASGVGAHVSAGAGLDDAMDRADEVMRRLDAIMRNKYANNPGVLAEWLSASHTERAPRHRSKTSAPQTQTAGGTPPPAKVT